MHNKVKQFKWKHLIYKGLEMFINVLYVNTVRFISPKKTTQKAKAYKMQLGTEAIAVQSPEIF